MAMSNSADSHAPRPTRLLDIDGVRRKLGGDPPPDCSTIYRLVAQGVLPRPIKVGTRLSRWREHEIDTAIARWTEARDAGTG